LVYHSFIALADRKKGLMDDEIADLVRRELARFATTTAS
jgi:hypothetical protein